MAHEYFDSRAAVNFAPIWRAGTSSEPKGKRVGISVKTQAHREHAAGRSLLDRENPNPEDSAAEIPSGSSRIGAVTCPAS
jgi:hypothetical protein